jgi:cysteine-rich repeat protein
MRFSLATNGRSLKAMFPWLLFVAACSVEEESDPLHRTEGTVGPIDSSPSAAQPETHEDHSILDRGALPPMRGYTRVVSGETGPQVALVFEYLRYFGYFPREGIRTDGVETPSDPAVFGRALSEGLSRFQRNMGLPITGELDSETLLLMNSPRCPMPDSVGPDDVAGLVPRPYVKIAPWPYTRLSFSFGKHSSDLPVPTQRAAVIRALETWAAASPLRFTEKAANTPQPAEILVSWVVGSHGDPRPFVPNDLAVAHAAAPACDGLRCADLSGDLHFNDDYTFVDGNGNGAAKLQDVETIALHELGHSLGLNHSTTQTAVMYAFAPATGTKRKLDADDIAGIRDLYPAPVPRCGDGFVDLPETCDDGNLIDSDACSNTCKLRCGDGIVQAEEQCDDGNRIATDGCSNTCTLPRCGDGIVQSGETCDDGNTLDGDACPSTCRTAAREVPDASPPASPSSSKAESIEPPGPSAPAEGCNVGAPSRRSSAFSFTAILLLFAVLRARLGHGKRDLPDSR